MLSITKGQGEGKWERGEQGDQAGAVLVAES